VSSIRGTNATSSHWHSKSSVRLKPAVSSFVVALDGLEDGVFVEVSSSVTVEQFAGACLVVVRVPVLGDVVVGVGDDEDFPPIEARRDVSISGLDVSGLCPRPSQRLSKAAGNQGRHQHQE